MDKLTGLPNRALLVDRLQQSILRHQRHPDRNYALLFLDFDRFKIVNDSLGHDMGDQLLIRIAQRLRAQIRGADSIGRNEEGSTAARLGGDEFVIFLEDIKKPQDAQVVAQRLLDALAEPHAIGPYSIVSSASIGIVTGSGRYQRAEDVLRDADTAMYQAKLAGRGRYVVFDSVMRDAVQRRLELEHDLRAAIQTGQLELHYQPIVDLESGRVVGVEALARWRHPTHGVVHPAEFIPIAEECDLIVSLGDWVIRTAVGQLARWTASHGADAVSNISINLSRQQLMVPDIVQRIRGVTREFGIDPGRVHLEITESTVMRDAKVAAAALAAFKTAGFKLDMDDFGTGYSSLACLHQFQLDVLKIDRSFINNLDRSSEHAALVHAIISLARNLGMQVIAEGVETAEHVALLQSLDCQFAQGFYFAKPMPADQVVGCRLDHSVHHAA
jgi:diguanylate cyclase (GGDEF)-like protein